MSAQDFNYDGMRNWVWRKSAEEEALTRMKCMEGYGDMIDDPIQLALAGLPRMVNCSTPRLQHRLHHLEKRLSYLDRPKWFDYLAAYCPGRKQAGILGLDYNTMSHSNWVADRVTNAQFKLHWKQQRKYLNRTNQTNKPIFGLYLDLESHFPYSGYDNEQFYSPSFNLHIKRNARTQKEIRFKRVNHYSDRYFIGETIRYLKENDPDTIVIITGDHGSRDMPIRGKNTPVTEKVVYSEDCVDGSSGPDSIFGVSAMISYLGDDPFVKSALGLDKLAGLTVKVPTDHNDLIYTVMELVSRFRGHSMPPTNRRSRNLIQLTERLLDDMHRHGNDEAVKTIDESGWQSLSSVSLQMEYRNGTKFLRTHTGDVSGSHYYHPMSFPACLKPIGAPPHRTGGDHAAEMTADAYKYLAHENYLFKTNKLFHYGFRNKTCIVKGQCQFPEPSAYRIDDTIFYAFYLGLPFLCCALGFFVVGIVYLHDYVLMRMSFFGLPIPNDSQGMVLDGCDSI